MYLVTGRYRLIHILISIWCLAGFPFLYFFFFFFNDTATTEIYTFPTRRSSDLNQEHAAEQAATERGPYAEPYRAAGLALSRQDRKSTRLNSSHLVISYAVFCLKKKKITP